MSITGAVRRGCTEGLYWIKMIILPYNQMLMSSQVDMLKSL